MVVNATNYFVSANGSDSNNGLTIATPWKSLTRASAVLAAKPNKGASDTVFVRSAGGVFNGFPNNPANGYAQLLINGLQGTATNPCVFTNYPGESPLFDFFSVVVQAARPSPTALSIFASSYLKIKGLRFYGYHQILDGSGVSRGVELNGCSNITIEQCEVFSFQGTGFFISGGTQDVLYLNCDSHNNEDPLSATTGGAPGSDAWDNADGFGVTGTGNNSTRITFDGCRAWLNCDDGWDNFGTDGSRLWKNCWAYTNGYYQRPGMPVPLPAGNGQGFKLGPCGQPLLNTSGLRNLQNCLAFNNRSSGYDQNGEVTTIMTLLNCTAYANQVYGFQFQFYPVSPQTIAHVIKNCSALSNVVANVNLASAIPSGVTNNSWQPPVTISAADFLSTDTTGVSGARQADGSLPNLNFMKLVSTSDMVRAGTPVGLPICQPPSPDINWFPYCPASSPPIANSGADQVITLPLNMATVSGTATTSGSIVSWFWRAVSFPAAPTIGNPAVQTTTITNLIQGQYLIELKVVDNSGLSDLDTMKITVNAAPVTPPNCSANSSATITLPTNSAALVMSATSTTGGSISSYSWIKTSGPATGTIQNASLASTNAINLVQGTYVFTGTATDNNAQTCTTVKTITVNAAPNQAPTSIPCCAQVITLPTNFVNITGSGTDPDGTIVSYQYSQTGGIPVNIVTPNSQNTVVNGFTTAGIYRINLRVTDNNGATGDSAILIRVNPLVVLPTATCAPNITITLPTNSCTLVGTSTGTQTPFTFLWTKITGPVTFNLTTPTATQTVFNNLVQGTYTVEYKVTDNNGNIARDTMSVTVNAAPNVNPTSNPCCTQTITLPTASVSLTGNGTDPDGTIVAWQWSQTQGLTVNIVSPNSQNTTINNFTIAGTYKFNLRVTDNNGGTGNAVITITVNPAIIPAPTVIARTDTSITLPVNSCALTATATGTGLTYKWNKLSASAGNIINSTSINATAQNLVEAVYLFEIVVTDVSMNVVRDTFQLTVMPIPVYDFTVSAGADQQLYGVTSTTLTGTAFSSYGVIDSYLWQQIAGASSTIVSASTATTGITGLTNGVYVYSLTCTTSFGFVQADTVVVTVSPLVPSVGFKWYMATLVNGRSNISWTYNGAKTGTKFNIQKANWLGTFKTIGTVNAVTGKSDYTYIDNNTSRGNNKYRLNYLTTYTSSFTVKKK